MDLILLLIAHVIGVVAGVHALLTKRDPRAALGWFIICIVLPLIGVLLYALFGVNRIAMVAKQWESRGLWRTRREKIQFESAMDSTFEEAVFEQHAFRALVNTGNKVCEHPLVGGCQIVPLFDGAEAYPAMLEAIDHAKRSIYLSTYIFGSSGVGRTFIAALARAKHRGVDVRVLIDGIGALYSWPTARYLLKKEGVPCALFLRPFKNWYHTLHLNLRNHRKILVIDSQVAFTGGMNIHEDNLAAMQKPLKIHDLHFKVEGPIVGLLQDVFLSDWFFTTKQNTEKVVYFDDSPKGEMLCRGIISGPQFNYPKLQTMLMAAICGAEKHIRIMTPYFLIGYSLSAAAINAALRGVCVEVILPDKNNLSFVKGASEANLASLLEHGVKVYYRQGTFAHSKIFILDDFGVFLGSANWDVRSFYLNFEFNLEVYDHRLARQLIAHFEAVKSQSRLITLAWLNSQNFLVKLRNAFFRLFSLYL